jgi:hypothetical protein
MSLNSSITFTVFNIDFQVGFYEESYGNFEMENWTYAFTGAPKESPIGNWIAKRIYPQSKSARGAMFGLDMYHQTS